MLDRALSDDDGVIEGPREVPGICCTVWYMALFYRGSVSKDIDKAAVAQMIFCLFPPVIYMQAH